MARDMFSIHLPTLDRPEGGKAWKLLRATMAEVLSKLSARPFFPGGTLPSGPLMPALPLCTMASIVRREMGCIFAHYAMPAGARRIDWSLSPRGSSFE